MWVNMENESHAELYREVVLRPWAYDVFRKDALLQMYGQIEFTENHFFDSRISLNSTEFWTIRIS